MNNQANTRPVATLEIMQSIASKTGFNVLTETAVAACANGHSELSIPYRKDLTQHHGYLHGGLIGYLADTAISWAAASVAGDVVTSEFRVHILSPGKGERFVARGSVIKAGKRQVVARSDVYAISGDEEKLIATATGTVLPVTR